MEDYEKDKVTFINNKALSIKQIREILSEFGFITQIKEHGRRVFVRYRNDSEATNAVNSWKKNLLGLSFAIRNPRRRISYLNAREIKSRNHDLSDSDTKVDLENKENKLCKTNSAKRFKVANEHIMCHQTIRELLVKSEERRNSSQTPSVMSSSSTENIDTSVDGIRTITVNDIPGLPALIDSGHIPVLHSIILGNLPEVYALEDVHKLVEEIHPIGYSKLEHTPTRKLRFCEVYLRGQDDVAYLTSKLDNFIISGKRLIAAEPSVLLSRKIWNI